MPNQEQAIQSSDNRPPYGYADVEKKLIPPYFDDKWGGHKNSEIRKEDDVEYKPGMIVKYREWFPYIKQYGYRFIIARITAVYRNIDGLYPGFAFYTEEIITKGRLTS